MEAEESTPAVVPHGLTSTIHSLASLPLLSTAVHVPRTVYVLTCRLYKPSRNRSRKPVSRLRRPTEFDVFVLKRTVIVKRD
jgi:hypothetical protein